jgi:hypothetical protein
MAITIDSITPPSVSAIENENVEFTMVVSGGTPTGFEYRLHPDNTLLGTTNPLTVPMLASYDGKTVVGSASDGVDTVFSDPVPISVLQFLSQPPSPQILTEGDPLPLPWTWSGVDLLVTLGLLYSDQTQIAQSGNGAVLDYAYKDSVKCSVVPSNPLSQNDRGGYRWGRFSEDSVLNESWEVLQLSSQGNVGGAFGILYEKLDLTDGLLCWISDAQPAADALDIYMYGQLIDGIAYTPGVPYIVTLTGQKTNSLTLVITQSSVEIYRRTIQNTYGITNERIAYGIYASYDDSTIEISNFSSSIISDSTVTLKKDTVPIYGPVVTAETEYTYSKTAELSDSGEYELTVENDGRTLVSDVVSLTVEPLPVERPCHLVDLFFESTNGSFLLEGVVLAYFSYPTEKRYNQFVSETSDGEISSSEVLGFTIVRNELFIKNVERTQAEDFRRFIINDLQFSGHSMTISVQGNQLEDINLGLGFEKNPQVTNARYKNESIGNSFNFREPGFYDIVFPYFFKKG